MLPTTTKKKKPAEMLRRSCAAMGPRQKTCFPLSHSRSKKLLPPRTAPWGLSRVLQPYDAEIYFFVAVTQNKKSASIQSVIVTHSNSLGREPQRNNISESLWAKVKSESVCLITSSCKYAPCFPIEPEAL